MKRKRDQKIEAIVEASGMSRSTVFRYFSGRPLRPGAIEAIEQVLVGSPSKAEPTRPRRVFLISILPTYQHFRGYLEAIDGILRRSQETSATVRIGVHEEPDTLPQGVILMGKRPEEEDAELEVWKSRGVPCVLINRVLPTPQWSWVSADCRGAARQLVTHLLDQGIKRVAMWSRFQSRVSLEKSAGYRDALREAGISLVARWQIDGDVVPLSQAFHELMAAADPPQAWFFHEDEAAGEVLSLASSRGLSVPRDLLVAAMNDTDMASHLVPPLTSVRFPFHAMGETAVDTLHRLIDHPLETSVRTLLEHQLMIRASSRR